MKQKFLSILPLLLFTIILVNAQELTTYRGAFAPAPTRQWTEDWTNFNPQQAVYGATTITKTGVITADETWTSNNIYLLDGIVYVDSLVTLTIEPGTVIRGRFDSLALPVPKGTNSSLLIQRGGRLIAEGTPCRPIVFTSNRLAGTRAAGDWGGVLILGRARHNLGVQNLIEGTSATQPRGFHGGTNDDDNSGVLKYVRIEYSGFVFSANNEINGLTMGSVGRGTEIDYVQVTNNQDDAFEWFGGSVNAKHLVSFRTLDDDFDSDNGYSGTVQYAVSVRDPALADASLSSGFESDNNSTGADISPKTSAKFYNVTQIGAFRCASNANGSGVTASSQLFGRGGRLRRNTDIKIVNSILMGNIRGVFIENPLTLANVTQDSLVFRNNIFAGDFTTIFAGANYGFPSVIAQDAATRALILNPDFGNDSLNTCSLLTNVWGSVNSASFNPDFRPNIAGAGALVIDPTNLNAGADLSPGVFITGNLFTSLQTKDIGIFILENGGGASSGAIVLSIPKVSTFPITVPGLTLTNVNQSGTDGANAEGPYTNGSWNFRDDGVNIIATSKPGVVIPKNGFVQLGFTLTRPVGTPNGTTSNLGITLSGGSDATPLNNGALQALGAN